MNLLLSLALKRRRETAVRSALGASPARLARQALLENVLLSCLAGVVALLLAGPLSLRLGAYFARPSVWGVDVARQVSVDLSVVAFALVASLATGVAAGLVPVARIWRRDLTATLRSAGSTASSSPARVWGRRLIVSRAFVSVTLGLVVGLSLSFVLSGLVRGLLFGVEPTDPSTLAAGAGVLVLAALSAAYLPARRAALVDPTVSLRSE